MHFSKYPLLLLVLILVFSAFVGTNTKNQLEAPPGTEFFQDNLYIDQSVISNLNYLEFMYQAARYDMECHEQYINNLVGADLELEIQNHLKEHCYTQYGAGYDAISPKIIKLSRICNQFKERGIYDSELYLRNPAFNNYPVIGITKAQATAYCKWRTTMVKAMYLSQSEKKQRKLNMKLQYRLPTMDELNAYASSKGNKMVTDNCIPLPSYFQNTASGFTNILEHTATNDKFAPNSTAKGFEFTGFRCVCEVSN